MIIDHPPLHAAKFEKEVAITRQMVKVFASLSGDLNKLHMSDEFAQAHGFERAIAHGGLVLGLVSGMLAQTFGDGTIFGEITARFKRPAYVGDTINISLVVLRGRREKMMFIRDLGIEIWSRGKKVVEVENLTIFNKLN
ncbi:MAG: MaoC family dehydratase [bacterium]|nr:MaoC family dehydratase [bacterium]